MDWAGRKVLVTGAGGFIGSHLAERLVAQGAHVRALAEYNPVGSWGWLEASPLKDELEVVLGDVRDPDSVARAVRGADTIFHLAALIAIPYSYKAPLSYLRTNAEGTLNVLRAALELEAELVAHVSTSEVYGTARYVPIDEAHPLQGQSPYSASKIAADKLAEAFHLSYGLPTTTVRPFNTYGPRQSARAVIPTVVTQLLAGEQVELGNVTPTRDLTYVLDTADGIIAAAGCPQAVGQTVNLGSGQEISIADLVAKIAELMGTEARIVRAEERVRPEGSEVERLLADTTRARELFGWQPRITLGDGLRETIDWISAHLDEYRVGAYAV